MSDAVRQQLEQQQNFLATKKVPMVDLPQVYKKTEFAALLM